MTLTEALIKVKKRGRKEVVRRANFPHYFVYVNDREEIWARNLSGTMTKTITMNMLEADDWIVLTEAELEKIPSIIDF